MLSKVSITLSDRIRRILGMIPTDIWAYIITLAITSEPYYKLLNTGEDLSPIIQDEISRLITGIGSLIDLLFFEDINPGLFEDNDRNVPFWNIIGTLKFNHYLETRFDYSTLCCYQLDCYSCLGNRSGGLESLFFSKWITYCNTDRKPLKVCESCAFLHHRFFVPKSLALESGLLPDFLEQSMALCLKIEIEHMVNGKILKETAYEPAYFFHMCEIEQASVYYTLQVRRNPADKEVYEWQLARHNGYKYYFKALYYGSGRNKRLLEEAIEEEERNKITSSINDIEHKRRKLVSPLITTEGQLPVLEYEDITDEYIDWQF